MFCPERHWFGTDPSGDYSQCVRPLGRDGQHMDSADRWWEIHRADAVQPSHYKKLNPEPIDVIAAWGLSFNLGNVVKYLARADLKGQPLVDLRKAASYLAHEIARRESSPTQSPQERNPRTK